MKPKKLTSFKHTLFLGIAVLLIFSLTRNILSLLSTQSRLDDAQSELDSLNSENQELAQKLEKMTSPSFTEAQIRNKLGLAKEGEIILVFPEDDFVRRLAPNKTESNSYALPEPNWKLWLNLFL